MKLLLASLIWIASATGYGKDLTVDELRAIQSKIDGALTGTMNINDVIAAVEPKLWAMATVLPIMQDTTIVAAGPTVQNVSLTGAVPVGIVGDASRWVKTAP